MLLSPPTPRESVVVSTNVLKVFGSSSWASDTATTNAGVDRWITISNMELAGGANLYINMVASGTERAGAVSATDWQWCVQPQDEKAIFVKAGYELVVIRSAASTTKVSAFEYCVRAH